MEFMQMVTQHKLQEATCDIPKILKLLIKSYDDEKDKCGGCCSPYHSIDKETIIKMRDQIKEGLEQLQSV